jgi:hypothetical protein
VIAFPPADAVRSQPEPLGASDDVPDGCAAHDPHDFSWRLHFQESAVDFRINLSLF